MNLKALLMLSIELAKASQNMSSLLSTAVDPLTQSLRKEVRSILMRGLLGFVLAGVALWAIVATTVQAIDYWQLQPLASLLTKGTLAILSSLGLLLLLLGPRKQSLEAPKIELQKVLEAFLNGLGQGLESPQPKSAAIEPDPNGVDPVHYRDSSNRTAPVSNS
jgi:hypothetical protein